MRDVLTEIDRQFNIALFGEDKLYRAWAMVQKMPKITLDYTGKKVNLKKLYKQTVKEHSFPIIAKSDLTKAIAKYRKELSDVSQQFTYMPKSEGDKKRAELYDAVTFKAPTAIYKGVKNYLVAAIMDDGELIYLYCYFDENRSVQYRVVALFGSICAEVVNNQNQDFDVLKLINETFRVYRNSDEFSTLETFLSSSFSEGYGFYKNCYTYINLPGTQSMRKALGLSVGDAE